MNSLFNDISIYASQATQFNTPVQRPLVVTPLHPIQLALKLISLHFAFATLGFHSLFTGLFPLYSDETEDNASDTSAHYVSGNVDILDYIELLGKWLIAQ